MPCRVDGYAPRRKHGPSISGLGAYRVGVGDGGANADSCQWCTGSALARQVTDLRSGGRGAGRSTAMAPCSAPDRLPRRPSAALAADGKETALDG